MAKPVFTPTVIPWHRGETAYEVSFGGKMLGTVVHRSHNGVGRPGNRHYAWHHMCWQMDPVTGGAYGRICYRSRKEATAALVIVVIGRDAKIDW